MIKNKVKHLGLIIFVILAQLSNLVNAQVANHFSENVYKQTVVENNYLILAAEASVEAATSTVAATRKELYPSLDFVGSNRYFDEKVTPEGMPTLRQNFFNVGLNLFQNVY